MALNIGAGDEVITVPYTWISTVEVIALLGAKALCLSTFDRIPGIWMRHRLKLLLRKTKAIMPVSIYGQCSEMDAINAIAEKYSLPVIEAMLPKVLGLLTKVKNPAPHPRLKHILLSVQTTRLLW